MSTPTRLVRWPVALAALDVVRERTSGIQVEAGWPGTNIKDELIWLDEITSGIEYPHSSAGRAQRDETFDIPLQIRVSGGRTLAVVRARAEEILADLDDIFADMNTTVFRESFALGALEVSDPIASAQDTTEGAIGFGRIDLIGQARLS